MRIVQLILVLILCLFACGNLAAQDQADNPARLADQITCAKAAKAAQAANPYPADGDEHRLLSHYNKTLNRCFPEREFYNSESAKELGVLYVTDTIAVFDVAEGNQWATFSQTFVENQTQTKIKGFLLWACTVTLMNGKKLSCATITWLPGAKARDDGPIYRKRFEKLIAPLMEK